MSTQQYYPQPSAYAPPRQPVQQRQPVPYNPAGYNPAQPQQLQQSQPQQQQQLPQTQGGYNPGVYYPHAGAPQGRTTPQPPPAGRGYVPYANLQGVIGGVNRSAATETASEEAPPPYSPPQRTFNRNNHLSAPPLAVPGTNGRPISGQSQSSMYTPVVPSPNTSYQLLAPSPLPNQPTRAPSTYGSNQLHNPNAPPPIQAQPVQQYAVPDQRRMTSPPAPYGQSSTAAQTQQPIQASSSHYNSNSQQSNISMLAANTQQALAQPHLHQRSMVPPVANTAIQSAMHNSPEAYDSPPSPTSLQRAQTVASLPLTGARRERDTLPLRRPGFNTAMSEPVIPKSNSPPIPTAQQPQPPVMGPPSATNRASVGIPPPPPGPPPPQAVARRTASESVSRTSTPIAYPGPASMSGQTPTTAGGTKLPNGMPLPPPPGGAPPKPVMIQPAPLGRKRNKPSNGETSPNHESSGSDNGLTTPGPKTPKSPYGAYSGAGGGLPFRSTSTANATTPGSSTFPQPQSIMRSQKSSGDLASGGLRTTTPKDVRFVIPDDESEYGSTVDTDSRRNSILEENPSFAEHNNVESRNPLASIQENSILAQDTTMIKKFQGNRKTSMVAPAISTWGTDEKASIRDSLPPQPTSAPATDRRFYPTPTPPFSPSDSNTINSLEGKMANMNTKSTGAEFLPTPPITNQVTQSQPEARPLNHAYASGYDDGDDVVDDLPPFYHEAIGRHNDMILEEATATNDEKRLNVFVDFVMEEARMRGEMYNHALGVLGPGLQLFPTEDPQYMTPEQQAYEYERSQGSILASIRRTSTVKEQKSRTINVRRSGTVSNPMSPKEAPKRSSWFMTASGASELGSSATNPDGSIRLANGQLHYPEGVYPPEKGSLDFGEQILSPKFPNTIDLEPLLAMVPAYPRQFSASDNSHPGLQKHRKAIASLKDLTCIQKNKFEFATSVPKVLDAIAAETRARKSQHQDHTQRLFNEGRLSYEEMDRMNTQFEREEGDRRAADIKKEFDRYQKEVMKPVHAELMQRVDQTTAVIEEMQKDISFGSKASGTVREGPELLEVLNLMRHAFEMKEYLYSEIQGLIAERNKRYKEVVITPFINDGDAEHINEAEEFFDEDGKRAKVESDKEALERTTAFTEMMERNVVRGVEKEVSDFWDIAPTLSDVIDKIPQDLTNFKPMIPEDELYTHREYSKFPLLYLRTNLEYAGNSIYQHAQAQIRLLGFSLDLAVAWNNAKWALKDSERVMAGEEEQRTVWQLERQKKEEEIRQTKNEEEKLKTVREEWTESIGNKLNDIKRRLEAHLVAQGGWPNDASK